MIRRDRARSGWFGCSLYVGTLRAEELGGREDLVKNNNDHSCIKDHVRHQLKGFCMQCLSIC